MAFSSRLEGQAKRWFRLSGAERKRKEASLIGLSYDTYLQLQIVAHFDAERQEQFFTLRKDVQKGRSDAIHFAADVRELMIQSQVTRFGKEQYIEQNREQIMRVLQAYTQRNKNPGYVQGMNYLVAVLLCFMGEDESFWTLCAIVEDLRTADFYSKEVLCEMNGFVVEKDMLCLLVEQRFPRFALLFGQGKEDLRLLLQLLCSKTLIPLFVNTMPVATTVMIWDMFFCQGGEPALLRVCLCLLKCVYQVMLDKHEAGKLEQADKDDQLYAYGLVLDVAYKLSVDQLEAFMQSPDTQLRVEEYALLQNAVRMRQASEWIVSSQKHELFARHLNMVPKEVKVIARAFWRYYTFEKVSSSTVWCCLRLASVSIITRVSAAQTPPNVLSTNALQTHTTSMTSHQHSTHTHSASVTTQSGERANVQGTARADHVTIGKRVSGFIAWAAKLQALASGPDPLHGKEEARGPSTQPARRRQQASTSHRVNGGVTYSQFAHLATVLHAPGTNVCTCFRFDRISRCLPSLFAYYDRGHAGWLNFQQLLCYLDTVCRGKAWPRALAVFSSYDRGKKGVLIEAEADELTKSLLQTYAKKNLKLAVLNSGLEMSPRHYLWRICTHALKPKLDQWLERDEYNAFDGEAYQQDAKRRADQRRDEQRTKLAALAKKDAELELQRQQRMEAERKRERKTERRRSSVLGKLLLRKARDGKERSEPKDTAQDKDKAGRRRGWSRLNRKSKTQDREVPHEEILAAQVGERGQSMLRIIQVMEAAKADNHGCVSLTQWFGLVQDVPCVHSCFDHAPVSSFFYVSSQGTELVSSSAKPSSRRNSSLAAPSILSQLERHLVLESLLAQASEAAGMSRHLQSGGTGAVVVGADTNLRQRRHSLRTTLNDQCPVQ